MRRILLSFNVLFISFLLTSCDYSSATATISENNKNTFEEIIEAKIIGSEESFWQSTFSNLGGLEFLEHIQVIDEKFAFVLGESNNLYKTTDGGKTWKFTKIEIPKDSFVSSISFFDFSYGLASVIKSPDNVLDIDNFQSWIIATEDGGKTWQKQFEINAGEIKKVAFDKEKNGWAIGRRIIKEENIKSQPLVLTNSKDGWQELANPERLGSLENIFIQENLIKKVIDSEGRFFELSGEMEWKVLSGIETIKPPQIKISTVGITKEKIYLIGATGGREGIWTSLFSKHNDSELWQHYTLENVILRDALFLSSDEIFACGSINQLNNIEKDKINMGIILHSNDGGLNWKLVYKTSKIESFVKLWNQNKDGISAFGENGDILHLMKSP